MTSPRSLEQGFTLIELMIALVLGLLIAAAALALFMNAQRSSNFQSGMSNLQQNTNFGLAQMTHDLRHANLNTPSEQKINNKDVGSGVIFNEMNLPATLRANTNANLFTRQGIAQDATNAAEGAGSDQITIQFVPDVRGGTQYDCEGALIEQDRTYVYRYYLDLLPKEQQIAHALPRYGLYCDSGSYASGESIIRGLGASGQLVVQSIDAFKVRFLVKHSGNLRYTTINQYLNLMPNTVTSDAYHHIGGLELGLLVTSLESIGSDSRLNDQVQYTIAGQPVTLRTNSRNNQYLRQPITQMVSFRNTLGVF